MFGRMFQPIPTWSAYEMESELLAALGLSTATLPIEIYDNGVPHVLVAAPFIAAVASLEPRLNHLAQLHGPCFSVFAGEGSEWKTRMFAPAGGVDEDPATGSAAGPIAVHLARHGRIPWNSQIRIQQGAELGRPSTLYAKCSGSPEQITEVEVGGSAVAIGRGELRL